MPHPSTSPADAASVSRAGAERPIIFSAPMVRALLAGRKTQTRRLLNKQDWPKAIVQRFPHQKAAVPYLPGDRLWVKEPVRRSPDVWLYEADGEMVSWRGREELAGRKRDASPAMYLPRSCSRLTLLVTEARVERLQDISEADAEAEGCEFELWDQTLAVRDYSKPGGWFQAWSEDAGGTYVEADRIWRASFRSLWESIHGLGSWDANPWVAAVTFKVIRANIDATAQAIEARRAETRSGSVHESAVNEVDAPK